MFIISIDTRRTMSRESDEGKAEPKHAGSSAWEGGDDDDNNNPVPNMGDHV